MSEEEKKALEILDNREDYRVDEIYEDYVTVNNAINTIINLIEKQQKEIEYQKELYEKLFNGYNERVKEIQNSISKDKIREKIKELEEQQEKLKYDGNVCFADYEQFCKNLKFLKEQIEKLLKEK